MKRTISILVIVAMMLASLLAIIPASAAEGTAISNAEEFAAMTSDGEYYLANDITISAPVENISNLTLDGNGKTITLDGTTTAFKTLSNSEVRNLTVVASYEAAAPETDTGALANKGSGIFQNVHAVVEITYTEKMSAYVGGLFGKIDAASTLEGCTAKGFIKQDKPFGTEAEIGGAGLVGGVTSTVTFKNCVNYVDLTMMTTRYSIGGIIGLANGSFNVTIENCVNYGSILTTAGAPGSVNNIHSGVGGIVGQAASPSNAGPAITIKNSRNYGKIEATAAAGDNKDRMLGGILGRVYGSKTITIEGCVNSGDVISVKGGWGSSGGILGNAETYNFNWSTLNEAAITVSFCVNTGNVTGNRVGGIVGTALQANSPKIVLTVKNSANYGDVNSSETTSNGKYAGGIIGGAGDGSKLCIIAENCYNAGKVTDGAGIMAYLNNVPDSNNGTNKDVLNTAATVKFANCINEGEAKTAILNQYSGSETAQLIGCATTVDGQALSPESSKIESSETPEKVEEALGVLKDLVPASTKELDELVATTKDYAEDDYKEGWDNFASAYEDAGFIANKASSLEEVTETLNNLKEAINGLVLIDSVDKNDLTNTVAEAEGEIDSEDKYTPKTWAAFKKAYDNAVAVLDNENSKQSEVNKANEALRTALDGLMEKPNLDELNEEIAKYEDITADKYVSATWAAFSAAFEAAKAVRDNGDATAVDVREALAKLTEAYNALEEKVDLSALEARVKEVNENYKSNDYTAKSFSNVTAALRKATDAIESNDTGASGLKALNDAIDAAIKALVKRAKFETLKPLVDSVGELSESDYTPESWEALTKALTPAEEAMKPANSATVSEADETKLVENLQAAIDALVKWADYTEINAILAEIRDLKETDYTADSWKALQDLLTEVETLKSNRNATELDTADLLARLKTAKEALVSASGNNASSDDNNSGNNSTDKTEKKGCKSFVATSVAVVAVVTVLGTAVVLKKKEN